MGLRKYERAIIMHQCKKKYGTTECFHEEWDKYRNAKLKKRMEQADNAGITTSVRAKPTNKKRRNSSKNIMNRLRMMKKILKNK